MRTGFRVLVSIVVLLLAGAVFAAPAQAQHPKDEKHPQHAQQKDKKHAQQQHAQADHAQPRHAQPGRAQPQHAQPRRAQPQHAQAQRAQPRRAQPRRAQPRAAPVTGAERQRRVDEARARGDAYRGNLSREIATGRERAARLKGEHRSARYQAEEGYLGRLREERARLPRSYEAYPGVLAPPMYRYRHGGEYYETSRYGANMLRRAVRYGYREGWRIGRADREDRAPFGYRDSWAYEDANYGYEGLYVPEDIYNYYFREGFRRGYEDGYYSRHQYGTFVDGGPIILAGVLGAILALTLIH